MDAPTKALPDPDVAAPPLRPHGPELMQGFRRERIKTPGAEIAVAVAGEGPPLLLLHGNPLTLVSWHKVAPTLAESFTVVAADLRGYGDSAKPELGPIGYTFRAMGEDNFAVMSALGFERFAVAGHDRGARVAFRMALDQPERVARMAALDIVPTHHVLTNVSLGWALESYHWTFMAQKAPFPEKLLSADLDYYMRYKLNKKGVGLDIFTPEAMAEYIRCATPEQIHAVCEDYRATVTLRSRDGHGRSRQAADRVPRARSVGLEQPCRAALQAARGLGRMGLRLARLGRPDRPLPRRAPPRSRLPGPVVVLHRPRAGAVSTRERTVDPRMRRYA